MVTTLMVAPIDRTIRPVPSVASRGNTLRYVRYNSFGMHYRMNSPAGGPLWNTNVPKKSR